MGADISRRRFLGISAAAAGFALLPLGGPARAAPQAVRWHGRALGAPAELILHHPDREQAERLIRRIIVEIDRLERIFSLYIPDSALNVLNANGALADPPPELVAVLEESRAAWRLSGGLFDPTIQPLWALYARHFAAPEADPAGPSPPEIGEALTRVGLDRVAFDGNRIAFRVPGMALTLNGIAQGYITDRAIALLRAGGVEHTLADLGEIRALGPRGDGTPWRAGIAGTAARVDLVDRAMATSGTDGFRFAGPGSPCHLIDPRSGTAADRYRSVSVVAPTAAGADALSTAFSFMRAEDIAAALPAGVEVHLYDRAGGYRHIG